VIIPTYLSTVPIRQYNGSRTDPKERDPGFEAVVPVGGDAKTVFAMGRALSLVKSSPDRLCRLFGSCGFGAFGTVVNFRRKQGCAYPFLGPHHFKGHIV
jgi:hypothetical protein